MGQHNAGNLFLQRSKKWLYRSWNYRALALAVFLLVSLIWWRVGVVYENHLIEQKRSMLQIRGDEMGNSLSLAVNQKQALLNGLAAFVKTHSTAELRDHYFAVYAAGLQANDPIIRAIQFIPNDGLILVYPIKGNEAVANRSLDQLRNDERVNVREDVRRTIESQKITLSDPYELRQGGQGVVARLAVYDQGKFLGLVSVILDIEPLLKTQGLSPSPTGFHLALQDVHQHVFFGEESILSLNPLLTEVRLPEGYWTLALLPAAGWASDIKPQMTIFMLAGFFLASLLAGTVYYLARRQFWLSETVQVQSEEIIQRGEKLQLVADASGIGFFHWDIGTNQTHYSPEWKRQIGYDVDEIQDDFQEWQNRLHPDDLNQTLELLKKSLKDPSSAYEAEFRLRHKDGSHRWILARGSIHSNEAGEPARMLGCHIDVTKQKQNEAQLLASEHRFRGLAENSPDYIMLYDRECRHVYQNPAGLKVAGMTEADIIGKTHLEAGFDRDLSEMWEADIRHVFATGDSTQRLFEWESANGPVFLDWRLSPIFSGDGQVELVLGVSRDITSIKQTEKALLKSENRLRFAMEGANDGLWDVDLRTDEVYMSPRGCEILGYQPDELAEIAKVWHQLVHPDDMPKTTRRLDYHIRGDAPIFEIEQRLRTKSGDWKWILTRGKLVERDPEGRPVRMTGTHTDISERKKAEEKLRTSEETLKLFVEYAPASIAMFDRDMKYIAASRRYLIDYRLADQNIVGRSHYEVFPEIPQRWKEIHKRSLAGEIEKSEEDPFPRADGSLDWVRWEIHPWYEQSGEIGGILLFSEVITERKHAEEEIHKLNTELEQRVAERTAQLEAVNKELEAFSYSVSHDLRAPLRGIDGWSLALFEDYHDLLDEKGRQYIDRVRAETQRMGQLIDDILRLSRLTRTEMKQGVVNLSKLVQIIIERLMETKTNRSVEWVIQPDLIAYGDAQLLEIVLTNLLSNAFKFTSKLPVARIEFGQTIIDGKATYFVRDNGAGFNMAYAKNLFGAFQRMHKQSDYPGTGIGLATAQRIIRRHGGSIWAIAEKNVGATFYFTLEETLGK